MVTKSVVPEPEGSSPHSWEPATGPYPEPGESTPHPTTQPISLRSVVIPSSIYALVFQVVSFLWAYPPKPCSFLPSSMHATCPAHLILLDLIYLMVSGEEYRLWSSPLCNFLHSSITSSVLAPNILLGTLFSNTLSLYSSLNVRGQVFLFTIHTIKHLKIFIPASSSFHSVYFIVMESACVFIIAKFNVHLEQFVFLILFSKIKVWVTCTTILLSVVLYGYETSFLTLRKYIGWRCLRTGCRGEH
jgi:hypothetical protein